MSTTNTPPPVFSILTKIVFGYVELEPFFRVFRVFNTIKDSRDIDALTLFYGVYLSPRKVEQPTHLSDLNLQGMLDVKTMVDWMRGDEDWQTEEDAYLSFSYHLLLRKEITRTEAAQFASIMLRRPIEQDLWRKRVDRWAKLRKLQEIGQTKRRPRK